MIDKWDDDLRGISDDGVRDRVRYAREQAASALSPGTGRKPKAARMWRAKLVSAEAELERRGLGPQ